MPSNPLTAFGRFSCRDEKYPLEFRYTLETNSFVPIMPLSRCFSRKIIMLPVVHAGPSKCAITYCFC